ncbi:hypothetical protein RBU49_17555 [Clostridium sp. MB40-C1]|uniref:hypothetical protein n=1 Tax=Clostridium sp. MB40-C1 TaxID=3070996 RepID=UPI0027E00F03|nr:hypothetical protein [Clostridium sp. MB40-C1]WMJ80585.1 hypothetical protein RBU49_17555 [Clostridium sp. MB40-C1]
MLRVFCDKKGTGKTKALIQSANESVRKAKGNVVFIDDDDRRMFQLDRKIRFISTDDYEIKDYSNFYGFLCGILSKDYDISSVYIDGLFNIVSSDIEGAAHLFYNLEKLSRKRDINFYININYEKDVIPEFIKKYVA